MSEVLFPNRTLLKQPAFLFARRNTARPILTKKMDFKFLSFRFSLNPNNLYLLTCTPPFCQLSPGLRVIFDLELSPAQAQKTFDLSNPARPGLSGRREPVQSFRVGVTATSFIGRHGLLCSAPNCLGVYIQKLFRARTAVKFIEIFDDDNYLLWQQKPFLCAHSLGFEVLFLVHVTVLLSFTLIA